MLGSDPNAIENLDFRVLLTAGGGPPESGSATVFGAMTPTSATDTALTPRFEEPVAKLPAFQIAAVISTDFFTVVSAASYDGATVAPDSLAAGFGQNLASALLSADAGLPTQLGGASIEMIDAAGLRWNPRLIFVSPGQINFWLEPGVTLGPAVISVLRQGRPVASGQAMVARVAPSLFSANGDGRGVAAAEALRVANGATRSEPVGVYDAAAGRWRERPLKLGSGEILFLTLYGTGIRGRENLSDVRAEVGGEVVSIVYAGAQSQYPGLDQINIGPLPAALAGRGAVEVALRVAGTSSNRVTVAFE